MPPHWKTKNTRPPQSHQQKKKQQHSHLNSSISISSTSSSHPPPRPPSQKSHPTTRSHPHPPHRHPLPQPQQQSDLRRTNQSQGNNKTTNNNIGNNHKKKDHHHHHHQNSHFDDHCSSSSSIATPSSVYMPSVPLSRDNMSDLSGLSGGTRSSSVVPGQIFDPKTFLQPWRQAYCLSVQQPPSSTLPLPPSSRMSLHHHDNNPNAVHHGRKGTNDANQDNNDPNRHHSNIKTNHHGENNHHHQLHRHLEPRIWVGQNDAVEIFGNLQAPLGLDGFPLVSAVGQSDQPQQQHKRIPIMILLMDPHRHCYELMQIWVDRAMDSIRDLVQALQQQLSQEHHHHHHLTQLQQQQQLQLLQQQQQQQEQQQQQQSLSKTWKQTYDGIFQVRGHRFTQLINIIRLVKYDVHPNEILVAKPWSMSAKLT
jgi:hypothetical protein